MHNLKGVCRGFIFLFIFVLYSSSVLADPPLRVARIGHSSGDATFLTHTSDEWKPALRNFPLTFGDKLLTAKESKLRLDLSGGFLCLGPNTSLNILNLDEMVGQFQINQGIVIFRLTEIDLKQEYELDTPNVALSIQKPGYYRVEVNPDENWTSVSVMDGQAIAYGEEISYVIYENKGYRFKGTTLDDYVEIAVKQDEMNKNSLDKWCKEEGPKAKRKISDRFVSREVVGYEDLDNYGEWKEIEGLGNVWAPTTVSDNWAPYYTGQWMWVEPWGWTWIDEAPWGFAPYHYGRWTFKDKKWYWVPGPMEVSPVYAQALVEFITWDDLIGWFPLAPMEYYWPPHNTSKNYFIHINASNTKLSPSTLTQIYEKPKEQQDYRNLKAVDTITAIPRDQFATSTLVSKEGHTITKDKLWNEKREFKGKMTNQPNIAPSINSMNNLKTKDLSNNQDPSSSISSSTKAVDKNETSKDNQKNDPQRVILMKNKPPMPAQSSTQKLPGVQMKGIKSWNEDAIQRNSLQKNNSENIKMVSPSTPTVPVSKGKPPVDKKNSKNISDKDQEKPIRVYD